MGAPGYVGYEAGGETDQLSQAEAVFGDTLMRLRRPIQEF